MFAGADRTQKMADNMGQQFVILISRARQGCRREAVARAEPDGTRSAASTTIMTMVPNLQSQDALGHLKDLNRCRWWRRWSGGCRQQQCQLQECGRSESQPPKAAPGQDRLLAPGGPGSPQHLAMAMFCFAAGISLTHVPYKGRDGRLQPTCCRPDSSRLPGPRYGRSAGARRSAQTDRGADREAMAHSRTCRPCQNPFARVLLHSWFANLAPAATAKDIVARLNAEVLKAVGDPQVRRKLAELGLQYAAVRPRSCVS